MLIHGIGIKNDHHNTGKGQRHPRNAVFMHALTKEDNGQNQGKGAPSWPAMASALTLVETAMEILTMM